MTAHNRHPGSNGVCFQAVHDCWASEVRVENCDLGFGFTSAKSTTLDRVVVGGRSAHHSFACRMQSHDNLVDDFEIEPFTVPLPAGAVHHGLNLEGLSAGNVWRRGPDGRGHVRHPPCAAVRERPDQHHPGQQRPGRRLGRLRPAVRRPDRALERPDHRRQPVRRHRRRRRAAQRDRRRPGRRQHGQRADSRLRRRPGEPARRPRRAARTSPTSTPPSAPAVSRFGRHLLGYNRENVAQRRWVGPPVWGSHGQRTRSLPVAGWSAPARIASWQIAAKRTRGQEYRLVQAMTAPGSVAAFRVPVAWLSR